MAARLVVSLPEVLPPLSLPEGSLMSDLYGGSGPLGEMDKRLRAVEKREADLAGRVTALETKLGVVERALAATAKAAVKACSCQPTKVGEQRPPAKPRTSKPTRKTGSK
jgi:hypothetical protein